MKKHILSIISILLLMFALPAHAITVKDSAELRFRTSHTDLDTTFADNPVRLAELRMRLDSLAGSSRPYELRRISVIGGASPEGSLAFNEHLSRGRAARIFDYFNTIVSLPDSATSFTFLGRDWAGLHSLVMKDVRTPSRDRVLEILDSISSPEDGERALKVLKALDGGRPYSYLYRHHFPALRESRLFLEYEPARSLIPLPDYEASLSRLAPRPQPVINTSSPFPTICHSCRPFYMALKTNMLSDVLALPEIGIEFYLGRNFSIVANWTYGWWDTDSRHRYWRAYGGDIAGRWWFGKAAHQKPLTGHHIGIYAGVNTWDFEWGGTGYMGGKPGGTLWDKCLPYAGVEYGYSLPIARRLNIDFTLGIGYMQGTYYKYIPRNGQYVWQSTHKLRWFGPTKAEISLVWLIGCDNFNK